MNEAESAEATATKKRVNVLFIVKAIIAVIIAVLLASAIGCVALAMAAKVESALTIIIAGINGGVGLAALIAAFGSELIKLDAQPFDTTKAGHERDMAKIAADERVLLRKTELEHEYRNAENEFRVKALDAAAARA